MQVLSIEPVSIREQSQLNKALLISAQCPINVYTFLQNGNDSDALFQEMRTHNDGKPTHWWQNLNSSFCKTMSLMTKQR